VFPFREQALFPAISRKRQDKVCLIFLLIISAIASIRKGDNAAKAKYLSMTRLELHKSEET
jgi:hypothetical protein